MHIVNKDGFSAAETPFAAEIENIIFNYAAQNDAAAINDVSFQVRKGECLLLTGLSGCGKTSILRLLNGLIPRYYEGALSGSVLIGRENIANLPIYEVSKKAATVFQNPKSQFFNLDTTSEILFFLENTGTPIDLMRERLGRIASFLHIEHLLDRNIFNLSGGQKQRVSIGAAVASGAQLLIFDEPTSGMDYFHMKETASLIKSVRAPDRLILIISHDFEFLSLVADELLLMENGKIVSQTAFSAAQAEKIFEQLRMDEGRDSSA